jgi:phage terminase large subunit GpA-like protein
VDGAEVPDEVKIITAGIDTQDDRVEILVLGHGHGGRLYVIDYKVIAGDFQYKAVKDELDKFLINKIYTRVDGFKMKVMGSSIDTGGHRTKAVYEYVKHRLPNRIFGIKGASTLNAPVVNKQLKDVKVFDSNLFIVGTTTIKDDFYARLGITEKGYNYVHFPKLDIIDKKFFDMLTAEKRDDKGKYIKVRTRNEAIDTMVYAIATLTILDIKVDELVNPILHIGDPVKKHVKEREKSKNWLDEY